LAKSQVNAGADEAETAQAQYETLEFKLKQLQPLHYDDATLLTDALRDVATEFTWSAEQRKNLVVLVNKKLRTNAGDAFSNRRCNQECASFELYLTAEEIESLADLRLSDMAKRSVLKKRCRKMGLHCASETTKDRPK